MKKNKWALLLTVYFFVGYYALNFFNLRRSYYIDVAFDFESRIPFFPIAIFGYLVVFLSLIILYVLMRNVDVPKVMMTLFSLCTVHFLLFLLLPVKMELRPELSGVSGTSEMFARLYFLIDQPTNCFPSLHVAWPTTGMWLIWKKHPRWRIPFFLMTLVTAVSVILVKQHYIADVVAGAGVASLLSWIVLSIF